jgi:hypothetical protein
LYRIRTAGDRLAVNLPAHAKFDTEPLRIDGRSVMLETQKNDYFIPIVAPNAETPFILEMRYTIPDNDGSWLELPIFPQDSAVQKVFLAFYLPEKKTLLGAEGPWSKEFHWWLSQSLMWQPIPNAGAGNLLAWVREGVNASTPARDDFQIDGTMYLYSTLRPESPPNGTLALTIMDARWLQALVFLVIFLTGLLLVPARCRVKSLAVGSLIAIVILLGVFSPIFAMQILNGILGLAIFLVFVLWTVAWMFRFQRRSPTTAPAGAEKTPPTRDSGVDLSQYEPDHAATQSAEPSNPAKESDTEGGKSHE